MVEVYCEEVFSACTSIVGVDGKHLFSVLRPALKRGVDLEIDYWLGLRIWSHCVARSWKHSDSSRHSE
jgi:hypothetical protein